MSTNPIPMIAPDLSSTKLVPQEQVSDAADAGWEPAAKMVGPNGAKKWVPHSQVQDARQANFAITQDSPGTQKMVSPAGTVNYVLPQEAPQFQQKGFTSIAPDGSFNLQNIPGEDPLAEQKRYQRVRQALTPTEKAGANRGELADFGKAMVGASMATAAGVTGASGAGAASDATAEFLKDVGAHIASKYAGQTAAKITADFLTQNAGKLALGGGLGSYLIHKLTGGKP